MVASAPDPSLFRSGRQFAAWLGLTLRVHSSGKERQVGIRKMGDGYLRRLLVVVPRLCCAWRASEAQGAPGSKAYTSGRSLKAAAVALADKTARIAWVLLARRETYAPPAAA